MKDSDLAGAAPIQPGLFTLDGGRMTLIGGRCAACGTVFFPKPHVCLDCGGQEVIAQDLGGAGELYSFTTVHMPSGRMRPPFSVALVRMADGPLVYAPLERATERTAIGQQLQVAPLLLEAETDAPILAFQFVPEEQS